MPTPDATLGSATYFAVTPAGSAAVTNISNWCTRVTPRYNAPMKPIPTMGNSAMRKLSGFKENGYDVEGVWDTEIDGYLMGMNGGTAAPGIYGAAGSVSGKAKHSSNLICTAYSPPSDVENAVTFRATFEVDGAVTRTTF